MYSTLVIGLVEKTSSCKYPGNRSPNREKVPHMNLVLRQVKGPDVLVSGHQNFDYAVGCRTVVGGPLRPTAGASSARHVWQKPDLQDGWRRRLRLRGGAPPDRGG